MVVNNTFKTLVILIFTLLFSVNSYADTPITLFQSYAGNINFVGTQATRRTQPNNGTGTDPSCAVLATNATNTASISGIPSGATIRAAHLYWAGSYSTQANSSRKTPDNRVRFEGATVIAPTNRRYTSNFTIPGRSVDFYSGVADVTAQVNAKKNGTYSLRGLAINNATGTDHCDLEAVLAGWSLIVVYEHASEDFRVVNLFEGFQTFRNTNVTLIPDNFVIPASPINGKQAHITWEGDPTNLNGNPEQLTLNGINLIDGSNPVGDQFNSVSTVESIAPSTGSPDTASYGVDFDVYNIDAFLTAGDTSATSFYASGNDLVILSAEVISVTNTPVSDLQITKTHAGNLTVGQNATYSISVKNNGPIAEPGPIVVTDTLPAGLTYISATGSGWSCGATGQLVTCTHNLNLGNNVSTGPITLTVAVSAPAFPSVTNTATVSGTNFDNISSNNSNSDTASIAAAPNISLQKTSQVISDGINTSNPKRIPGSIIEYTITATNSGISAADNNTIVVNDAIPANTEYVVNSLQYLNGTPSSGMTTAILEYSTDGTNYNVSQSTVTSHIRVSPQGQFLAPSGSGNPSFQTTFQVQVK